MAKVDVRTRIVALLNDALTRKDVELEMVLAKTDKLKRLDALLLQAFLENNGFQRQHLDYELDIIITPDPKLRMTYRITIMGSKNIADFCNKKQSLRDMTPPNVRVIEKSPVMNQEAVPMYDGVINLKHEKDITADMKEVSRYLLQANSRSVSKLYRLKNRVTFTHPDYPWKIDYTEVKSSPPNVAEFDHSGIHEASVVRELEIEMDRDKAEGVRDKLYSTLDVLCRNIVSVVRRSPVILTPHETLAVLNGYLKLTRGGGSMPIKSKTDFKAAMYLNKKPKTLTRANMVPQSGEVSIYEDGPYAVTYKADGENCQLFIDNESNINIIYDTLNVARLPGSCEGMRNCICSAELVEPNDKSNLPQILIYEAYFIDGKPVWQNSLYERFTEYTNLAKTVRGCVTHSISSKPHLFPKVKTDLPLMVKELENTAKTLTYDSDGIIFTKVDGTYEGDSLSVKGGVNVFKWKPPALNSVDCRFAVSGKGEATLTVGYNPTANSTDDVLKNIFKGTPKIREYIEKELARVPIELSPGHAQRYRMVLPKGYVFDDPLTNLVPIDLFDNTVVECRFDRICLASDPRTFKFIPVPFRTRDDKTETLRSTGISGALNDYNTTVIPCLNSIHSPITPADLKSTKPHEWVIESDSYYAEDMLVSKTAMSLSIIRTFHNGVKSLVYNVLAKQFEGKSIKLIDFGSGKGGDIEKYKMSGIPTVLGIDLKFNNVYTLAKGAYDRYSKMRTRSDGVKDYLFLALDASQPWTSDDVNPLLHKSLLSRLLAQTTPNEEFNNNMLRSLITGSDLPDDYPTKLDEWKGALCKEQFDIAVSMFAFHYFLESETTLKTVVKNIATNLKKGGIFAAIMADGHLLDEALTAKGGEVKSLAPDGSVAYSIKKIGNWKMSKVPSDNYGKKVDLFMSSIANFAIPEPVVDFRLLDEAFKVEGMEVIEDIPGLAGTLIPTFFDKLASNALVNTNNSFYYMDDDTRDYINMHRVVAYRKM